MLVPLRNSIIMKEYRNRLWLPAHDQDTIAEYLLLVPYTVSPSPSPVPEKVRVSYPKRFKKKTTPGTVTGTKACKAVNVPEGKCPVYPRRRYPPVC